LSFNFDYEDLILKCIANDEHTKQVIEKFNVNLIHSFSKLTESENENIVPFVEDSTLFLKLKIRFQNDVCSIFNPFKKIFTEYDELVKDLEEHSGKKCKLHTS